MSNFIILDKNYREVFGLLMSGLDPSKVVVVGGTATANHLEVLRGEQTHPALQGIDLVYQDGYVIPPTLQDSFGVAHYHPNSESHLGLYWMLVHKAHRIKINIFPPNQWPVQIEEARFDDLTIGVIGAENQLSSLVHGLQRLDEETEPDLTHQQRLLQPKHPRDVKALMEVVDLDLAQQIWEQEGHQTKFGRTLVDAVAHTEQLIKDKKDMIKDHPFEKDNPDYKCSECESKDGWQTMPFSQVYELFKNDIPE